MNKPKFDPSKPFEEVKPKFDPSAPYQAIHQSINEHEESGILPTIVDKLANGISGNFIDEVDGGLEGLGTAAGIRGLGGKIKDLGFTDDGPTTDWDVIKHAYVNGRDKSRANLKQESEDHPMISGAADLAGAVVSPINKLTKGMSLAQAGGTIGLINGLGASEGGNVADISKDALMGGAVGGALGKAVDVASPYIAKGAQIIGDKLGGWASGLAENATGATGLQASKFKDGAGRELLDRGLVKFGDKPVDIAGRLEGALNESNSAIDSSLKSLDENGASVNTDSIVSNLESKIKDLKSDPSKADVVRKLQSIVDDITETGNSNIPLGLAEQTKRGFNKMSKNWQDPNVGEAGKQAYLEYMNSVEGAAKNADQSLADKFMDAKKTYGLLAPIQEAAERRALTTNQSPFGGLGDMAAAATGGSVLGVPGAVASVIGKKVLAPRATSSAAVTLDAVSKALMKSPQMAELAANNPQAFEGMVLNLQRKANPVLDSLSSKLPIAAEKQDDSAALDKNTIMQKAQGTRYSQALKKAAQNGDQSFNAANYVLSQRDPEYRKMMKGDQ